MALQELESADAVQSFLQTNKNALVCFSATWCGPCTRSKPELEAMASQYQQDVTMDVAFGIAYEHNLGEAIHNYQVRAFPTYILFQNQQPVNRVEGANLPAIREMIQQAGCQALTGGETLGGGATPLSPEQARLQRLARLGAAAQPPAAAPETPAPASAPETAEETKDVEMKDAEEETEKEEDAPAAPVDPTANLDKEALMNLTESMGFPLIRAQKGLLYGNGGTLDGAIEWIMQHQDDQDIDEPIPAEPPQKAQSYKCNDCGKILSNMANLELHANKTGHSDFQESTEAVKPLTAEEKAAKIAEIKNLLKAKRAEREEQEKVDEIEREKQRRFMAKEMTKTKEQMEIEQRKRDAIQRRKEKEAFKRERERIRAELAKDKAERKAKGGKLGSKLGVEGYTPDGIQYDNPDDSEPSPSQAQKKPKVSTKKIDEYIGKVSSYRAGGDGGKCLKILLAYVSNVVDNPDEEKFKIINMENKAFKTKVKPFIGAKQCLMAVGFQPNETQDALVLGEDADPEVLASTKTKLADALAAYNA
jgi:thiol-disulfide isomerase/thioredoxin